MGWQADSSSPPGEVPGRDNGLPAVPTGFGHGGAWDAAVPSALLAAALEAAAGPEGLYEGAGTDALVGMARQWAAIESWAAAGLMGALRAMMREDSASRPLLRRRSDLPDGWDDSLNYEIAAALAMGPVSAGNLAGLAWTLGTRLPGIGRLLADGTLTRAKAKLVVQVFEPLDEGEAARAEALIIGDLAGQTYFQVERLAWRAALAVAPDVAARRRRAAERDRARVTVFREESGAVGLSGRDLPAAPALSGHANVLVRAQEYEASGAFEDRTMSGLQALAYVHLLNGVSAADAIAFARAAAAEPPDGEPSSGGHDSEDPDGDEDPGGGAGSGDGCGPVGGPSGPGTGSRPVLPEVTVPLANLLGRADRPGDSRLLGPLDPALARDLATAAARSPHSSWEITITDDRGYAIGHGLGRRARGQQLKPSPDPARSALPARINLTITQNLLRQLAARPAQPRSGAPPGGWNLASRNGNDTAGSWVLTVPCGQQLAVRFDVVPTHVCDHRYQADRYEPGERLRRLVQVRDCTCTFPTCSRPARDSDFEHAVPYDRGGATCGCNAGARSRRCHQVKQAPGWTVTQPKPGWHQWTTPTGRTYTREPWRYIA